MGAFGIFRRPAAGNRLGQDRALSGVSNRARPWEHARSGGRRGVWVVALVLLGLWERASTTSLARGALLFITSSTGLCLTALAADVGAPPYRGGDRDTFSLAADWTPYREVQHDHGIRRLIFDKSHPGDGRSCPSRAGVLHDVDVKAGCTAAPSQRSGVLIGSGQAALGVGINGRCLLTSEILETASCRPHRLSGGRSALAAKNRAPAWFKRPHGRRLPATPARHASANGDGAA